MCERIVATCRLPRGVDGMCLCGLILLRPGLESNRRLVNHERIHLRQQREWLFLPFFILYALEWLWHLARLRNRQRAYRAISFEREAYTHDHDLQYLLTRKPFANYRKL